jgi:hypothetical protein
MHFLNGISPGVAFLVGVFLTIVSKMTTENWLTIALIITNFIALLTGPIGPIIAARLRQPKPTPVPGQQKNRIQRMGGWLMQSPWRLSLFAVLPTILVNIFLLRDDIRSTAPITRRVIFQIALGMGGIVYSLLSISILFVWQAIGRQTDLIGKERWVISELLQIVKISNELTKAQIDDLRAQINALVPTIPSDKPTQGTLRKLLAGIKNLFETD